ncbi:hypothetical protein EV182_004415, partial [Spiromyces aspiralis]
ALIFVTRSHSFCFLERPSVYLMIAFVVAQLVATFISVYANWGFTRIRGCGWHWAGVAWVWDIVWFIPLDFVKIGMRRLISRYVVAKAPPQPGAEIAADTGLRRLSTIQSMGASYYESRTRPYESGAFNFGRRMIAKGEALFTKSGKSLRMNKNELQRFQSVQTQRVSQVLSRQHE